LNQSTNDCSSQSIASWKNWQSRLSIFQQWRKKSRSPLIRKWWSYLASVFFHELESLNIDRGLCLDVGCGAGTYLSHIVEDQNFGVGLDPLKSSLTACKTTLKRNGVYKKADLVLAIGEFVPFKGECVNLCIITGSLDHVNEPAQVATEFERVLSHGGHLMLFETASIMDHESFYDETHVNHFNQANLERLLSRFTIIKVVKKVPLFSQIHVPDLLIHYNPLHKMLSKIPGVIGSYFNYYVVLFECKKS
jgi:ubiquinone/menaquinone biosynthesis C-methylase UbiE